MEIPKHDAYMRVALQLAQRAMAEGEVPTGCVIVHPDPRTADTPPRVIGRAYNQVELLKDATAHAEMIAITQAASALGDWRLSNTVLYVTKEPCAMCAGAIVLARIPTVVFGAVDLRRGGAVSVFNILDTPEMNHRCEVIAGVLENDCAGLLRAFFQQRRAEKRAASDSPPA